MQANQTNLHYRVASLLARAVEESGQSTAQIARKAGLKWDTVRRTLDRKRAATIPEIVAILGAAGFEGDETLKLMLLVDEDFALNRSGGDAARFLGELLEKVPVEIIAQLGDDVDELRPRWANGTAKMLARTLSQHVADLNRRGDAIGQG
jgi:antitoxin HigA-1